MAQWTYDEQAGDGGLFQVVMSRNGVASAARDVTLFRGVPTEIGEYTTADPFGDATATLTFPSITPFDDLTAPDISTWLGHYADVDIYWVPVVAADDALYAEMPRVLNALTQRADRVAPAQLRRLVNGAVRQGRLNRQKVFEGFVASMDFGGPQLEISCQGALFQVDRYLQKPFFPLQPWPLELLIEEAFKHDERPHLRTQPLRTHFPAGWGLKIPKYTPNSSDIYTPAAKPGTLWSGYVSRETGSWDHALTGFVQNLLGEMITDGRSGVTKGNSWTVHHYRAGESIPPGGRDRRGGTIAPHLSPGRVPVLEVRSRRRPADFVLQYGLPGIEVNVTSDSTQSANVVYGEGTGVDGTQWRNAVVGPGRTSYLPLAYQEEVYPANRHNPNFNRKGFVSEAYVRFGAGFDLPDAVKVTEQNIQRDADPGWTGTITLQVDPVGLTRWTIKAGMTVKLLSFAGSGANGVNFHIASTTSNPNEGTVELTVDTRYRDLLTVEEARSRTRDPMNPVKMLQVGKSSVMIEDVMAPWDYRAGSGFVPQLSVHANDHKPVSEAYPYVAWTKAHPPLLHPHWYTRVAAASTNSLRRWSSAVPIRMSERGTIARSEFRCVDIRGNPLKIPFHVSLYYVSGITGTAMPLLNGVYSPFHDNAFERTDANGAPNQQTLWGPDSIIIGWGSKARGVLNRAGFWPGRETDGSKPTGLLVDESSWTFDLTNTPNGYFKGMNAPGKKPQAADISIYAMYYCEYSEDVYFQGRLFRQNPGTG